jgi:hypothetical protein
MERAAGTQPPPGTKARQRDAYCNFVYSALASFRMGMSGSASPEREEVRSLGCGSVPQQYNVGFDVATVEQKALTVARELVVPD